MRYFLIVAIAVLGLSVSSSAEPRNTAPQKQDGRFVMVFGPFARADIFMLDTHTGRIWANVVDNKKRNWFQEVPVEREGNAAMRLYHDLLRYEAAKTAANDAGQAINEFLEKK